MYTNNIMLTGYWPPTNEMLRRFSKNRIQNPSGWIGKNWEGNGFDIFAFFPEFPRGVDTNNGIGVGEGDFPVDYQETAQDFYRIADQLKPCAIITFSRDEVAHIWTVETASKVYNEIEWISERQLFWNDNPELPHRPDFYRYFLQPPIDGRFPGASGPSEDWSSTGRAFILGLDSPGSIYESTLPIDDINRQLMANRSHFSPEFLVAPQPFDRPNNRFLSNYIACLGMKYGRDNSTGNEEFTCVAAGHIHAGKDLVMSDAILATEISLRQVLAATRERLPSLLISEIQIELQTLPLIPGAGTISPVKIEVLRDGEVVHSNMINITTQVLIQGEPYRISLNDLAYNSDPLDPHPGGTTTPPNGIQFYNGLSGHFSLRFSINGEDDWIFSQVKLSVKELKRNESINRFEPLWVSSQNWIELITWRRAVRLSSNTDVTGMRAHPEYTFRL